MAGNLDFLLNLRANTRGLDDIRTSTSQLVQSFYDATRALAGVSDASDINAENLEQMAAHGQAAINQMNGELRVAQLELNRLAATNATPQDIENARNRVHELEQGINQASSAVDAYRDAAAAATQTPPVPSQFQEDVSSLVTELDSARRSIDANGNSATHTRRQLEEMTGRATAQIEQYEKDLRDARLELNRLSATNATPEDIQNARNRIRELEQGVDQTRTALDGFRDASNTAVNETGRGFDGLMRGADGTKFAVSALAGAMAALGLGLGVRELADAADSYTNLSARINIATKDGGDFTSAMAGVHRVALATNTGLDATGDLFTRLNTVGKEMGMTQQNTLDLTQTINQAIQTSGGSAQSSEAAITQLIQAMQGGVLRGEEFNSIMENGYGVAEALAKGLGVTTGELRKMAENGELSAERVYKALLSQKDAVQQTYDNFPLTVSNALQKIATSWQILIGEMDRANGASATVANALSVIADNLGILKVFFDDVAEGVGWFQDKLSEIDPSTIESIRSTLSAVYDTIKTVISSLAGIAETAWSAFTSTLDAIAPLFNAILNGKEGVSGLTTLFNVFKIALGIVSDAATGLNIALKLLLAGIQFISGGIYSLSAAVLDFLGFDDLAAQAQNASDALFRQAEKNTSEAKRLALESKSATREAIKDITQTEEEANQERVADSQKTLDQLKAQEEKHKADYKAISDERIQLNQQLQDARKAGDQSAIDAAINGLAQLDAKEKAYQAESKKITDDKIKAAQDWVNAQLTAADGTQKAADAATQKTLQTTLAAQGLKLEFDSAGKAIVKAMDDGTKAAERQSNATDKARKAATTLGLDLDVSLNRVSEKFKENGTNVDNFVAGLEGLGVTGKQAGDLTYQAWIKWLETAKSQAEIDAAKAKLQEFGSQGQVSTSQVEQGLIAIKLQAQKLPDDIDPVTASFKALGIETKENLKLAAQKAVMDFVNIRDSGKATAEGVQKAYEKMASVVAASGDAGVIASANAAGAGRNLQIQIDTTGKASVKSMDELTSANERVKNSAERIGDGYRGAGQVAREEAQSVKSEWEQALESAQASNEKFKAEMKRQGEALKKGIYEYNSYSKTDVISQLKSKGYDDKEAERLAGSIWSKGLEADRSARNDKVSSGNPAMDALIKQEFDSASSKGLTTQWGTNKINELLRQVSGNTLTSSGPSSKPVDVNSLAPQMNKPVVSNTTTPASKSVAYNINIGGQAVTLYGDESDQDPLDKMMRQLETLKKGM